MNPVSTDAPHVISALMSFMTINKKHLDRHFSFSMSRAVNNSIINLESKILKKHALLKEMIPQKGNSCYVSIQNRYESSGNGEKVLIFGGKITEVSSDTQFFKIKAQYTHLKEGRHDESFVNATSSDILNRFLPDLTFEGKDEQHPRVILEGSHIGNLNQMMSLLKTNYLITLKKKIVVLEGFQKKDSQKIHISNCVQKSEGSKITIFPIPQLELGDIVVYEGRSLAVKEIYYRYQSLSQMIIGVEDVAI